MEKLNQKQIQKKVYAAAKNGGLKNIPKAWLTLENLKVKRKIGEWNCFQAAAYYGHLDEIPKQFLTLENLLIPEPALFCLLHYHEEFRQNSFHIAARSAKGFDDIPTKFLTPENLLKNQEKVGHTPLEILLNEGDGASCFKRLSPREWTRHLPKLRDIRDADKWDGKIGLSKFIERVENEKKFKDLPALRL